MSKKSDKFKLHETAYRLGMMPQAEYLELQYGYVKSKVPACNYFLISALCEAGRCENGVPWYRAAEFNEYLVKKGWKQLRLDQLKAWFVAGIEFDSILQKDGVTRSRMGHVAVPVGVGSDHRLHIAEGSFGTITNHVEAVRDGFVLNWNGGFRIFVRTP